MRAFSPGMLWQCEVVQAGRWKQGPLELAFVDACGNSPRSEEDWAREVGITEFNMSYRGGEARLGLGKVLKFFPWIEKWDNPNLFLVKSEWGYTELHAMLASVLPDDYLQRHNIRRESGNFWLSPVMAPGMKDGTDFSPWGKGSPENWFRGYAARVEAAFEEFIFSELAGSRRLNASHFSVDSPLRVLAGDVRYWMHRLYRIAVARNDEFGVVEHEDKEWSPLEELERKILAEVEPAERTKFAITRPHYGGLLWDEDDEQSRREVLDELIGGSDVVGSLEPVLEVVRSHRAHEDFSKDASWVKEDFERAFYHKRSRVKVLLVETVDDRPVWDSTDLSANGSVIFRDILSFFDQRDRRLVIALRHGKTVTEMARELGLRSHTAVSRRLARIKQRLRALLE